MAAETPAETPVPSDDLYGDMFGDTSAAWREIEAEMADQRNVDKNWAQVYEPETEKRS